MTATLQRGQHKKTQLESSFAHFCISRSVYIVSNLRSCGQYNVNAICKLPGDRYTTCYRLALLSRTNKTIHTKAKTDSFWLLNILLNITNIVSYNGDFSKRYNFAITMTMVNAQQILLYVQDRWKYVQTPVCIADKTQWVRGNAYCTARCLPWK